MNIRACQLIIQSLWNNYEKSIPYIGQLFNDQSFTLDHLAIIDLPSQSSGIPHLKKIFGELGFLQKGSGYLPEKQNDFLWMAFEGVEKQKAEYSTPQTVIADFRLDELSATTREVIHKYLRHIKAFDYTGFAQLAKDAHHGNKTAQSRLAKAAVQELWSRPWSLPTTKDYLLVKEENQLLAWVLLHGRKVNHFGVSIHLNNRYKSLKNFNKDIIGSRFVKLNNFAGEIKGNKDCGIEQSSTLGREELTPTADGEVMANNSFIEFVWRFPLNDNPIYWGDYYSGFIPKNANNVIESIYN